MAFPFAPVRYVASYDGAPPETDLPELAFAGRSNAGKSSALNRLLNAKIARVSHTPGRTQLLNFFEVGPETARNRWHAVDLPGYGYAKVGRDQREAWGKFIEGYFEARQQLRGAVVLVDGRIPPQESDAQLLAWLADLGRPTLVLATKLDDVAKSKRFSTVAMLKQALGTSAIVGYSSREDIGWEEARLAIQRLLKG